MKIRAFLATSTLLCAAGKASAQTIDYGSIEMLFGEPVTTSATGSAKRLSEAPATMEIITADEIRSSGETDLPGILSRVSGISTQRFSRNSADVAVRGYNRSFTPRLLVLVNGRQVYLDTYGYTQWDLIPVQLQEIRQIEIVKGPNTALFGFNAVGGVVNIITFDPTYDELGTASLRVDQEGGFQGSLVKSLKLGERLSARGSIGGYQLDDFDNPVFATDPVIADADPERFAASADIRYRLADKTILGFEATRSEVTTYERTAIPTVDQAADYETSSYRATFDSEGAWGLFSFSAYQNRSERTFRSPLGNSPALAAELMVVKAQNVFKPLPAHTLRVAAEYRDSSLELEGDIPSPTISLTAFDLSYDVVSGAAMWNWQASSRVSTTLAARLDRLEWTTEDVTEPSYNAAVVVQATDTTMMRFQASRGLQIPSLFDIQFANSLEPAIVDNYAVDLDHRIDAMGGGIKASVFYQQNEDLRQVVVNPVLFTIASTQVADSDLFGIELAADGRAGPVRWDASYTYLSVEDDPTPVAQLTPIGDFNFEGLTPEHEAKAQATYEADRLELGGAVRYVSEREFLDPFNIAGGGLSELDSYIALDLRAAYDVTERVALAFEGQDLTNDGDTQVPGGTIETRAWVSLTVNF
ncbi:TonB-dependent receptor plug domain-containing protein [Parvularcula lutaonensis]|uniref:TonB-dependent receptor plug domain-containing protein n=1 Tax=Parvularcula lutaonensis TaxID=491923 RepID=A0ABV7M8C1_9PROT|nr:TonB-dependent receptor [Parvularcula lutaonensis]GGY43965.1 hypothetical protein GCM10007148_11020 [Parvularcula lutaonensis]